MERQSGWSHTSWKKAYPSVKIHNPKEWLLVLNMCSGLKRMWKQIVLLISLISICIYIWMKLLVVLLAQSCLTLCDPMECSPPGSSVHGILPRILEWVAIPISRGSSQSRGWTWVSCLAGRFFSIWATREASYYICICLYTLDWLKSLSGFSLRCYGKTRRTFLANPVCS